MALPDRPPVPSDPNNLPAQTAPSGQAGSPGLPVAPPRIPTAAPAAPASPAAPATGTYRAVGRLTADMLLNGTGTELDHLHGTIVKTRDWLQEWLTVNRRADDVVQARLNPELREALAIDLDRTLMSYLAKESPARGEDKATIIAAVINEILGLGPIEPLWTDPRITEVMVNGPGTVFVEIEGKVVRAKGAKFRDREHLLSVCQQILMPLNRRVDQKQPMADGRLADGSRVNIVHYAVAPGGPALTIRRFPETVWTLQDFINNGSIEPEMATDLGWLIHNKASAVVAGGTGSGKTSLLNALSSCIPRGDRVVTVEDSLELQFHPDAHVMSLEARPSTASGEGEIRIRDLVKNALRMRPDRIVVGEVRDSSALDMLQAMNTGHEGSMTTVHANGADEVISRLTVMVAQGGEISESNVNWLIGDAVDLIVMQRRYEDGSRRVQGIYEVPSMHSSSDGALRPIPLWVWEQTDTDENGKFVGHYVRKNEVSQELIEKRRLDKARRFNLADIAAMSELPENMRKGQ